MKDNAKKVLVGALVDFGIEVLCLLGHKLIDVAKQSRKIATPLDGATSETGNMNSK